MKNLNKSYQVRRSKPMILMIILLSTFVSSTIIEYAKIKGNLTQIVDFEADNELQESEFKNLVFVNLNEEVVIYNNGSNMSAASKHLIKISYEKTPTPQPENERLAI